MPAYALLLYDLEDKKKAIRKVQDRSLLFQTKEIVTIGS